MIKITTDSTCDLPRELLERYNITVTPLGIIKAGKLYQDGVDIRTGDIAAHVDARGALTPHNADFPPAARSPPPTPSMWRTMRSCSAV